MISIYNLLKFFSERLSYDFSSLQCDLPDDVSMEIQDWGREIIPNKDLTDDGREGHIHVTVKYGIHITDPTVVRDIFYNQKPFEITLGKTDIFESDDKDVVIIPVYSPVLHGLNKTVSENYEVTDTYPEYKPHVTIAYVKKGCGKKYKGLEKFEGRNVLLDSVLFSGRDNRKTTINFPDKNP